MTAQLNPQLIRLFERLPELQEFVQLFRREDIDGWLVGGCLRDLLLERPPDDIDIVTAGDPSQLAQAWAERTGGHWFWLDQQRHYSRVLLPADVQVDFSPLRATTLVDDLKLRDFTINSMAISIRQPLAEATLIDPLGGCNALDEGLLEQSSEESFLHDPLRMLKGVRHAVALNLSFTQATWQALQAYSPLLERSAGERIRGELLALLGYPDALRGLELLEESGLLSVLLGPPANDSWSILQIRPDLERLLERCEAPLLRARQQSYSGSDCWRQLFLLVSLFASYQPADLPTLLQERLCFSRYQQRLIRQLIAWSPADEEMLERLHDLSQSRRTALVVEMMQPCVLEKLLFLGVARGRLEASLAFDSFEEYQCQQHHGRLADLLNGDQLIDQFGLSGPALADAKTNLKLAEIDGEIATSGEALAWLKMKNDRLGS